MGCEGGVPWGVRVSNLKGGVAEAVCGCGGGEGSMAEATVPAAAYMYIAKSASGSSP